MTLKSKSFWIANFVLTMMLIAVVAFAWNGPSLNPPDGSGAISADASNNVGVGTSAPTGKLTVRRSTAGNALVVRNTGDTADNFTINELGQVGMGYVPGAATRLGVRATSVFEYPLFITTDDGTARDFGVRYPSFAPSSVLMGTVSSHTLSLATGSSTEPGMYSRFSIDSSGKIGIGVLPTATARLTLTYPSCTSATCFPAASPTMIRLSSHTGDTTGSSIRAKGAISANVADLTEYVRVVGDVSSYEPGDIIEISKQEKDSFQKSSSIYSKRLAGVVSRNGGFVMGEGEVELDENGKAKSHVQLALAGRVPVKVTNVGGAIEIGDPITSSNISGVGMKATKNGRVIGFALEPYSSDGVGYVKILINPHYWIAE